MNEELDSFKKIVDEIVALKTRKANVYGNTWRVFGLNGLYAELGRKFSRVWINKSKADEDIDFETLEDSLTDLAVYSIMCKQLIREKDTKDKLLELLTK